MNTYKKKIEDLFDLFADLVSPEDVVFSKLSAEISSALSKERLKRHMTQSEFASFLGVQQSQVSKWEHGGDNFSLRTLSRLAVKLDLNVSLGVVNKKELRGLESIDISTSVPMFTKCIKNENLSLKTRTIRELSGKEQYSYAKLC